MAVSNVTGMLSIDDFIAGIHTFSKVSRETAQCWTVEEIGKDPDKTFLKLRIEREICFNDEINIKGLNEDITMPQEEGLWDMEDDESALSLKEVDLKNTGTHECCVFEYHVVYSNSYNVPVLYMNAYRSNGQLLTLEQMWNYVPKSYQNRLQHERWTFLTQTEHPLLCIPSYQLHPCHTSDLMATASLVTKHSEYEQSKSCISKSQSETLENAGKSNSEFNLNSQSSILESHSENSTVSLKKKFDIDVKDLMGYRYIVTWLSSVGPVVHLDLPVTFALYM